MARKIRIEDTGFHHILNRGVERRVIFDTAKDKEKFLDIVCEVSKHYDFIIHVYVLMDNHYHLLLENSKENLSAGMRNQRGQGFTFNFFNILLTPASESSKNLAISLCIKPSCQAFSIALFLSSLDISFLK